jgi:hypothetical protein
MVFRPSDAFDFRKKKKIAEFMPARLHRVPTIPKIDPVLSSIKIKSRDINPRLCPDVGAPR